VVQSRFAETLTVTLTLNPNPNFGETGFGESGRHPCCLDDGAEVWAPPGPGAVSDNVGRVDVEWSVVCVELARLVRRTVVVRVTDR